MFGGHPAGHVCTLGLGDGVVVDGCGLRVERLVAADFPLPLTRWSSVYQMPTLFHRPPGLHLPPCHACVSDVDRASGATERLDNTFLSAGQTCHRLAECRH